MGVWTFDPLPLALGGAALLLYAFGFRRLRSRRRSAVGLAQGSLYGLGVVVLVLALVSPIDEIGEDKLLSAHMLQHLLLGDVAPLLLVVGARGPMALFVVPPRLLRKLARVRWLRSTLAFLLRPRIAFCVWAAVVGAWHLPFAYDAAIAHHALHAFEHATFVIIGLLVWTQILDPMRHNRLSAGERALFATAILAAGMVLSEVLLLAGPLYAHYLHVAHRPFGFSAAEDQNRAGLLMMGEQISTLGVAAALLLWTHVERVAHQLPGADPTA